MESVKDGSSSPTEKLWIPFFRLQKARTQSLLERGWRQGQVSENVFFIFFGSISIYSVDDQTIKEPRQQSGVWKGV